MTMSGGVDEREASSAAGLSRLRVWRNRHSGHHSAWTKAMKNSCEQQSS